MNYATLIDFSEPDKVRVVNFQIEDGVRVVLGIEELNVPTTLEEISDCATVEPIDYEWRGEYLLNLDWQAQQFQNNYRKLQLIAQMKELLEAEESLAAQLADCRAAIKGIRGQL